jgi:type II secretory pathway pseudopilin PulG
VSPGQAAFPPNEFAPIRLVARLDRWLHCDGCAAAFTVATGGAMRNAGKPEHGFTIVEAIVALAIVTTGVLSLAGLATQVTTTVARARRHTLAAVLADQSVSARMREPISATSTDCLQRDLVECSEALDGVGLVTTGMPVFIRRWRAVPIAGAAPSAWGLTVCVLAAHERHFPGVAPGACVARIAWEAAP